MTTERWEYSKRPLTADTTATDLDALGDAGWELCAIAAGIGWFRRSRTQRELAEQGDRLRTDTMER